MPRPTPPDRKPTFAIIGAGMSGLLAAIKLREAGYEFTVFEKADRVGGTWRENTYPGIACDVPSHLYSYSFELNPDWNYMSSPGGEIQAYFEGIARRYDVGRSIRFNEPVVRCDWQGDRWEIEGGGPTMGHGIHQFDMLLAVLGPWRRLSAFAARQALPTDTIRLAISRKPST